MTDYSTYHSDGQTYTYTSAEGMTPVIGGRIYQVAVRRRPHEMGKEAYERCWDYLWEIGREHGEYDGTGFRIEVPSRGGHRVAAKITAAERLGAEVREVTAAAWMGAVLTPQEMIALHAAMERAVRDAGDAARRLTAGVHDRAIRAQEAVREDCLDAESGLRHLLAGR